MGDTKEATLTYGGRDYLVQFVVNGTFLEWDLFEKTEGERGSYRGEGTEGVFGTQGGFRVERGLSTLSNDPDFGSAFLLALRSTLAEELNKGSR